MADIFNLDDGRVEFAVNGDSDRVFYLYPSDAEFLNKIQNMLPELQTEIEKLKDSKPETEMQLQDLLDFDRKIREKINAAFQYNVCDIVFGDLCLSTAAGKNNMPVFVNFLGAIVEMFEKTQKKVLAEVEKRTKKYTARYEQK